MRRDVIHRVRSHAIAGMDEATLVRHAASEIMQWRWRREVGGYGVMEGSADSALPPERIRYRLTPLQGMLPTLPMAAAGVFIMLVETLEWVNGESSNPGIVPFGLWTALPLVGLIASRLFGVTLTESTAIVHNLRRRTIQWPNVQAIRIEPFQGARTIVIYEAGGRRTRLRAPSTGFLNWDRRFEEKFHTIGRWWLDHRGPDWVPVPPPGARWGGRPASNENPFAPPA